MKFKLDGSKFEANIGRLNQGTRKAVKQALGTVGLAILQDINDKEPKPPFETGFLRGAQFMYVNGMKQDVKGSKKSITTKGQTLTNDPPASVPHNQGEFTLEVGLNTPYAKRQHELLGFEWFPARFSRRGTPKDTSGVSGKFLEKKLIMFKDEYAKIFSDTFGKLWGK